MLDWNNLTRKTWTPNNPATNSEKSVAPKTISRGLLLTDLEFQVQDFLRCGLSRNDLAKLENKVTIIKELEKNYADEDNHFIALSRAKEAMSNRFTSDSLEYESKSLIKMWSEIPDNPITAAAILELGLFFVILPIYSQYGSTSLKITAKDISGDEQKHVIIHREVAKLLKARPSKQLLELLENTVSWFAQDIAEETNNKFTEDRCINNSRNLVRFGKSDIIESQVGIINCPFEISNTSLSAYN
jgi:hypothetical protein